MTTSRISKRAQFQEWLPATLFVHLDPRCAGVVVPSYLVSATKFMLVLQFGLGFSVPIRDLEATDEAVSATLSFNGEPFHCVIPWASVYAMVSGESVTAWNASFPPEMLEPEPLRRAVPAPVARLPKRPKLTLIRGGLS